MSKSGRKFANGDVVKIKSTGYVGEVYWEPVDSYYDNKKNYRVKGDPDRGYYTTSQLELEKNCMYNKQYLLNSKKLLEDKIQSINESINDINNKLDILNKLNTDSITDDELKAFKILEIMENNKISKIEKAKLISNILK